MFRNTQKIKSKYGKRNGTAARRLATEGGTEIATSEVFESRSSTPDDATSEGIQDENETNSDKPAKHDSNPAPAQANDYDPFAMPDSPPPAKPVITKLNTLRRERALQRQKELLARQTEVKPSKPERRRKSTTPSKPISSSSNNKSNLSIRNLLSSPSIANTPSSPPYSRSIENSPEPESESKGAPTLVPVLAYSSPVRKITKSPVLVKATRISTESVDDVHPDIQEDLEMTPVRLNKRKLSSHTLTETNPPIPEVASIVEPPETSLVSSNAGLSSFQTSADVALSRATPETSLNVHQVSQAEKDAWGFLEEALPVIKKPKLVAQLSIRLDTSDSENETETQADANLDINTMLASMSEQHNENGQTENVDSNDFKKWQTARPTFSFRKTYGAEWSYLSTELPGMGQAEASGLDIMDQLGLNKDEDDEIEEEPVVEDIGGSLKTVHDLRTLGTNTRFQDEVQYIIDGLSNGLSSKRSSLLELAEKCTDKDFVADFKVSSLPGELFQLVKDETDPITTFLVGLAVCSMMYGDKNIGLAASLIQFHGIVPLLLKMLPDNDDITLVIKRKSTGTSKVFQQLFLESLDKMRTKFLQYEENSSFSSTKSNVTFSRSLVALSAFVSLRGLDDKVDSMLISQLTIQKSIVEELFDFGEALEETLLPIFKIQGLIDGKESDDDEYDLKTRQSNIYLLHLLTAQFEFMISSPGPSSVIVSIAEMREPQKNFLLNLLQFSEVVVNNWGLESSELVNTFFVSILKFFILLTTNHGYHQVSSDKYSRIGKLFARIYEPVLAKRLVALLVKISDSSSTTLAQQGNLELFSWGLLINLCESEHVCESLLESDTLGSLKKFIQARQLQSEPVQGHVFHCLGYQSLVVGLLITVKGGHEFTSEEQELTRRGLVVFKDNLSESWGKGLKNQVTRVLASLEKIM
jgi:hypothetical protein